jgi:SNF2 family DNA or RNA helicase
VFAEIKSKGLNRSHIIILDALLKLRQVCCDPRLVKLKLPRAVTIADSAKLEALVELLEPLVDAGRKTLVFSQFTSMLDLVAEALTALEIPYVQLRGDTTDRVTPIARFQEGDVPVFLISLKAGGTGLNLTAADTVIHFDPWWNPAVEDQATDRAHRIGQDKKVFVYKLIASGTIEERMLDLQMRKRAICEAIFDADSADSISYSEADLQLLFQPLP